MFIKVFPFNLALTRTTLEAATVVPKHASFASDHDMASLMSFKMELIRSDTDLDQDADKTLVLSQQPYKEDYDQRL